MIRKIVLFVLALGFLGFGAAFTIGEMNISARTGDTDHFYAALFGGGLMGFVGIILMVLAFKKPGKPDPEAAAATVWAVGMTSMMDDGGDSGD